MARPDPSDILTQGNLQGYFHGRLLDLCRKENTPASDATLHYLTGLATDYACPGRLFDHTEDGLRLRPLALIYGDAVAAPSMRERALWLRRLGDLALFISALFSGRVQRGMVDLDYYAAMGGSAYSYLRDTEREYPGHVALREIFAELSRGFRDFVRVLSGLDERATRQAVLAPADDGRLGKRAPQLDELERALNGGGLCH